MKKIVRILSIIIFLGCFTALFAACKEKDYSIQSGTYYSVDNEDSYIVLTDETIKFHNVENAYFSEIEQTIFDAYGEHVDVAEILSEERSYVKMSKATRIYIDVYGDANGGIGLMITYDRSEKSFLLGEEKYVLREG